MKLLNIIKGGKKKLHCFNSPRETESGVHVYVPCSWTIANKICLLKEGQEDGAQFIIAYALFELFDE